ncbi:protein-L-isoaspartate(D-aspartate) O-methyltransferase [Halioxenophilus sp. WMMB6]|uniref:protein-L-isoaspartate(D-aspartate) O-methyltransferase n=1 Tax=Halioxenophilus sp. WMMB6 TaxID=3073815 RepID=UPI00398C03A0
MQFDGIGMTSQRTRLRLIERLRQQGIKNTRVLSIMESTPRHIFLDEALSHRAYEDTALPIGHGQTLSQPYIVARMTELLLEAVPTAQSVLEIGAGSGYQTAILAQLFPQVYSVERIKPLLDKARGRLSQLRLRNVILRHSDGILGWPQERQFDAILSAAAPAAIPESLLAQLAPGGALIIPVGDRDQQLTLVRRIEDTFESVVLEPVKFVPLLSGITR